MIASPRSHLEGLLLLEVRIWDAVEQGPCVSFGSGFGSGATWMLLRAVLVCVPGHTASVCVCLWATLSALVLPKPANSNSSCNLHESGMEGPPSSPSAPSWAFAPRKEKFRSLLNLDGPVTSF